jgi:hypothetical protein
MSQKIYREVTGTAYGRGMLRTPKVSASCHGGVPEEFPVICNGLPVAPALVNPFPRRTDAAEHTYSFIRYSFHE